MPENFTSLIAMAVVLVIVCGAVGVWTLRSRRRNATMSSSDRRETTLDRGRTS